MCINVSARKQVTPYFLTLKTINKLLCEKANVCPQAKALPLPRVAVRVALWVGGGCLPVALGTILHRGLLA